MLVPLRAIQPPECSKYTLSLTTSVRSEIEDVMIWISRQNFVLLGHSARDISSITDIIGIYFVSLIDLICWVADHLKILSKGKML